MKACINSWKEVRVKCLSTEREQGDKLRLEIRGMFNKIITAKNNGSNPSYIISQLSVKLEEWENLIRQYADAHNLLIRNRGNVLGGLETE